MDRYSLYPPAEEIALADHNTMPKDYGKDSNMRMPAVEFYLGELLSAASCAGDAQQWSWDPQSGPRHCGPLKELSDPEDPQMPEYALVPDDVARNFRCALCLVCTFRHVM